MIQLILHLVGDYVLQSDWMAQNKSKAMWPAFCHALIYSLPFLFIGSSRAVLVIFATHLVIDRYRLARYVVWAKDHLAPRETAWVEKKTLESRDNSGAVTAKVLIEAPRRTLWWHPWSECFVTGYPAAMPPYLAVWLSTACDNTLHLAINAAALAWL